MTYEECYARYVNLVEEALQSAVPSAAEAHADNRIPARLSDAMRYSLLSGGKRLRPVLLLAAVDMLEGNLTEALPYAAALEMIHAYSLIHDDLPGMDNDDLRRGKPTCHKVFGEGMAILTGDALQSRAQEIMLESMRHTKLPLERCVRAMAEMTRRAGTTGMIAGQCLDILCEKETVSGDPLSYIHKHKTADLFTAPLTCAGYLCGANQETLDGLQSAGQAMGLCFQIVDDLLDVTGDAQILGKAAGKDAARGKLTWPGLHGVENSRQAAKALTEVADQALRVFGGRTWFLLELLTRMTGRER